MEAQALICDIDGFANYRRMEHHVESQVEVLSMVVLDPHG